MSSSGNQELAADGSGTIRNIDQIEMAKPGFETIQNIEQIEMAKLFQYFTNVKSKACTPNAGKKSEAAAVPGLTEQLPPPLRFLRRSRSFSYTPSGPGPSKLSPCANGADGQSTSDDAAKYDIILEFLLDPTADPVS
jgi:hypothetical protein